MQRLRWQWLWIWVGVLVAGCGQLWSSENPPPATKEPTLPLFDYTLLPPSLTPTVRPWRTPTPLIAADNGNIMTSPMLLYLTTTGPACYETAVGSMVCLGQVQNNFNVPVENVRVVVQLLGANGGILYSGETIASRRVLQEGDIAPYRVLFDWLPEEAVGAQVYVKAGDIAQNVERRYADLTLRQVGGTFVLDQYQVSLSVVNKSARTAGDLVVTMTLLDKLGQVTGFRQVQLGEERFLKPGESLALTLKVIPQGPDTVAFEAFAEGHLMPN